MTRLSGIPTMFALMVRERDLAARLDLSSVVDIDDRIGAPHPDPRFLEHVHALFPNAHIENGFGTTEAGPAVFGPHPQGLPRPPLSVGYPLPSIGCRLVEGDTADQGVLALKTPALMPGYLNLPQATEARACAMAGISRAMSCAGIQTASTFLSGARTTCSCAAERTCIPAKWKSSSSATLPLLKPSWVPAPDDIKGQIPVAFVVPRPGVRANVEEIKQFALREGPAYAHPRFVEFRTILPVAGTHKIDRSALTAEAARISRAAGRSVWSGA